MSALLFATEEILLNHRGSAQSTLHSPPTKRSGLESPQDYHNTDEKDFNLDLRTLLQTEIE
jgi:hypothetical protein